MLALSLQRPYTRDQFDRFLDNYQSSSLMRARAVLLKSNAFLLYFLLSLFPLPSPSLSRLHERKRGMTQESESIVRVIDCYG